MSGLILGVINAVIVGVVLLLVGAVIIWFVGYLGFPIPAMVVKLYIALVALVVLYYVVAALLGVAAWGPFPFR